MEEDQIIKIQSLWRGFRIRKNNSLIKDNFTKELLCEYINKYINFIEFQKELNKNLPKKKIRYMNIPSEISENIVKFVLFKKFKYKFFPVWNTKNGDLSLFNSKIEVKASLDLYNSGPSSFGPSENWNIIYFVDFKNIKNLHLKVYEISLSSWSEKWKNLKVNKNETYKFQCDQKRRPRILFKNILLQIDKCNVKLIFDDNISEL